MSAITDTARCDERVSEPRVNADDTDLNKSEVKLLAVLLWLLLIRVIRANPRLI